MRQIKFRVWIPSIKQMRGDSDAKKFLSINADSSCNAGGDNIYMQFTGLKDKNGKEIYESDLIRDLMTGAILQVCFGHNKAMGYNGWYCKYVNVDVKDTALNGDYDNPQNNSIVVIGNIYSNPELL